MSIQTTTPEAALEADLEEDEQDVLAVGRAYADAKEYTRAAHLLLDCKSAKGKFMSLYFQFLVRRGLFELGSSRRGRWR